MAPQDMGAQTAPPPRGLLRPAADRGIATLTSLPANGLAEGLSLSAEPRRPRAAIAELKAASQRAMGRGRHQASRRAAVEAHGLPPPAVQIPPISENCRPRW